MATKRPWEARFSATPEERQLIAKAASLHRLKPTTYVRQIVLRQVKKDLQLAGGNQGMNEHVVAELMASPDFAHAIADLIRTIQRKAQ